MRQENGIFSPTFLEQKGGNKNLHHNIQSTGHWPKGFGPVFIWACLWAPSDVGSKEAMRSKPEESPRTEVVRSSAGASVVYPPFLGSFA